MVLANKKKRIHLIIHEENKNKNDLLMMTESLKTGQDFASIYSCR